MKLELNSNILPIVNIGMYQSILSPDSMFDDWEMSYTDLLSEEDMEYIVEVSSMKFNFEKYSNIVSSYAMEAIKNFFSDIAHIINIVLCEGYRVYNPNQYNYETDTLHFSAEINDSDIYKIIGVVEHNEDFFSWAYKSYKSYSGFISFMPYRKSDYITALNGKDIERALSMYLTYILEKQFCVGNKDDSFFNPYQHKVEEQVANNHLISEFVDDDKFHEIINEVAA